MRYHSTSFPLNSSHDLYDEFVTEDWDPLYPNPILSRLHPRMAFLGWRDRFGMSKSSPSIGSQYLLVKAYQRPDRRLKNGQSK